MMKDKKKSIHSEIISGAKKSQSHLEFFVDRSAETVDRALKIVEELQKEVQFLKDGLRKAENEYKNAMENQVSRRKKKDN